MAFTASNSKFATDGTLGADFDAESSTPLFKLGTVVKGSDGTEWMYVLASGAITQYAAVGIDEGFTAAALTKAMADDGYNIGFAQSAFTDAYYGWVAIKGSDIGCLLKASCAADSALYTTGTAGYLDDASTSQTKIDGVVAVTTITAATSAEVIATWPRSTTF